MSVGSTPAGDEREALPLDAYADVIAGLDTSPPADEQPAGASLNPTSFRWRDPRSIEPRQWLYGHHLIRKYVSATIAPGGVGKSTLVIADAVAMASGRNLIGARPHSKLTVWLWNGEDPREEIERRVIATCLHHRVSPSEIEGRLFLDSGREMPIKIGNISPSGPEIAMPVIEELVAAIKLRGVDVLKIDPFVSVHSLPENDNGAMDQAVKAFALVADRTGCAIDLVHHSRKLNGADADIDAARGGSAIAGAVRAARVLNVMSAEEAQGLGVAEEDRRKHIRIDDAKGNLAPPQVARWIRLASVALGNETADRPGDFVATVERWKPPGLFDGFTAEELQRAQRAVGAVGLRKDAQAKDWAGHAIGGALGLNSHEDPDRQRIKKIIKVWMGTGVLVIQSVHDGKAKREVFGLVAGEVSPASIGDEA